MRVFDIQSNPPSDWSSDLPQSKSQTCRLCLHGGSVVCCMGDHLHVEVGEADSSQQRFRQLLLGVALQYDGHVDHHVVGSTLDHPHHRVCSPRARHVNIHLKIVGAPTG